MLPNGGLTSNTEGGPAPQSCKSRVAPLLSVLQICQTGLSKPDDSEAKVGSIRFRGLGGHCTGVTFRAGFVWEVKREVLQQGV